MATTAGIVVAEPVHEIPHWLKTLPLAPEFHPTLAEFEDPISYILKIEKEASKYGICKIVPPVSLPSKKSTITNLNRSLSARNPSSNPKSPPTFTTRYQQIGFDPRKGRPVQKPVWQSGEYYTLQQFEAKAKLFEKIHLKKCGKKGGYSALEIETLFWRASVDKPFTVEYANDMPGSAFVPVKSKYLREAGETATVGETDWNMRGVARSKGSLLRFMKADIPGVTSPMVYIAMLFSWFAWHVEDHDLHSLNYMHMGAAKTWYGVPKDAAFAFQEVVRVHGYGGDFNPLVTFATLGEKTTVMSPEVLIGAGIPCCRLVQNVGEFVVTFPGAYHSGFSHGFNCAEASNIATPEWLKYAKEAAIRRASINCPPMVSHFQLLYALALTLCSRLPMSIGNEPRSSRLKDKKRGEGEGMVKGYFLRSVIQNNDLLHLLSTHGSSCVVLAQNSSEMSACLNSPIGTHKKSKRMMSLGFCSNREASKVLLSEENTLERNVRVRHFTDINALNETTNSMFTGDATPFAVKHNPHGNADLSNLELANSDMNKNSTSQDASLLERGRFPCVQCGILSFACAAVIEPRETAAQYFMSADCSFFNEWKAGSGVLNHDSTVATENEYNLEPNNTSEVIEDCYQDGLYEVPVQSGEYQVQVSDQMVDVISSTGADKGISSLDLLASTYGDSSDSDEELVEPEMVVSGDNIDSQNLSGNAHVFSPKRNVYDDFRLHAFDPDQHDGAFGSISHASSRPGCGNEVSVHISRCTSYSRRKRKWTSSGIEGKSQQTSDCSLESDVENLVPMKLKRLEDSSRGRITTGSAEICETDLYTNQVESVPAVTTVGSSSFCPRSSFSHAPLLGESTKHSNIGLSIQNTSMSLVQISKGESSRKHIFCLEHAVEVEKQLRPIGGANILLLCHPEYPKIEAEAKLLAQDLGIVHLWKDIIFREATKEDQERISLTLDDEKADPSNGDWAVKLGINLYYSVHLSKSPLYTKQMPYNSIIYKTFRCSSPTNYSTELKVPGKQKKLVVAGKWCGKVWMSNQVHPYLAHRETEEEEESMNLNTRAPSSCLKSEEKVEKRKREERSSPAVTTTIARKRGQKKKRKFGKATMKKQKHKSPELESPTQTVEDSSESDSPKKRRKFGKKAIKNQKSPELESPTQTAEDSSESDSPKYGKAATKRQRSPELESSNQTEEDSSESDSPATRKQESLELESPTQATEDSSESDSLKKMRVRKAAIKKQKSPSPTVSEEDSSESESSSPVLRNGRHGSSVKNVRQYYSNSKSGPTIGKRGNSVREAAKKLEDSSESDSIRFLKNTPLLQQHRRQYASNLKVENEGGPSTRLRRRPPKQVEEEEEEKVGKQTRNKKGKKATGNMGNEEDVEFQCDLDGCSMGFRSKQELMLHKKNICSVKGCGKKFFSHKYLVQHRRVHIDDRPLKCPWKGCKMTFKWAWARTEHIRVHTGDRPYVCAEKGCGQTFRFVSDFSRHKRKTGHSVKGKG